LKSRHPLEKKAAFNSYEMKKSALKERHKQLSHLPTRLIIVVTVILGVAILGSAIFTYTTLLRLRSSNLSNRGHEIFKAGADKNGKKCVALATPAPN
jgi:hypothetical protein